MTDAKSVTKTIVDALKASGITEIEDDSDTDTMYPEIIATIDGEKVSLLVDIEDAP